MDPWQLDLGVVVKDATTGGAGGVSAAHRIGMCLQICDIVAAHTKLEDRCNPREAPSHDCRRRVPRVADTVLPCDEFCPLGNVRCDIGGGISN